LEETHLPGLGLGWGAKRQEKAGVRSS
jgi:hypothetical protein